MECERLQGFPDGWTITTLAILFLFVTVVKKGLPMRQARWCCQIMEKTKLLWASRGAGLLRVIRRLLV